MPLFEDDTDIDGVIPYYGKYRAFFSTMKRLREFAPQLAVVLHGNDPDIMPFVHLAGSEYILRVPTRGTRYTFLLANRDRAEDATTVEGAHYVENRLRVLDTLGINSTHRAPRIHLPDAIIRAGSDKLAPYLRQSSQPEGAAPKNELPLRPQNHDSGESRLQQSQKRAYWVLYPCAADPYKNWPLQACAELIRQARLAFPEHDVVVTGISSDRPWLLQAIAGFENVHVLAGELSLLETAAVLAGASCVVAPDTGILHLAAALDRPVVGLYAPTSAKLVGPRARASTPITLQKNRTCDPCLEKQCPYTPRHCMNQIKEIGRAHV